MTAPFRWGWVVAGWLGNDQLDRATEKLITNGTGKPFAGLISNPDEFYIYIMRPSVVKVSMALFSTPKFGGVFVRGHDIKPTLMGVASHPSFLVVYI